MRTISKVTLCFALVCALLLVISHYIKNKPVIHRDSGKISSFFPMLKSISYCSYEERYAKIEQGNGRYRHGKSYLGFAVISQKDMTELLQIGRWDDEGYELPPDSAMKPYLATAPHWRCYDGAPRNLLAKPYKGYYFVIDTNNHLLYFQVYEENTLRNRGGA